MTAAGSKCPAVHIYVYYSVGCVTVAFVENALLDVLGNESSGCKKTLICTIIHAPFNDCWRTAFFFDSLAVPRCVFHRHSPMVSLAPPSLAIHLHTQPLFLVVFSVSASVPDNMEATNHLTNREEADDFGSNHANRGQSRRVQFS